ncbi:MAG TPA: hypothetical protein PLI31_02815 [Methanoregulaceae archaeon]|nr:hypothetical protein [Methanoregulaceae archaeon]
MVLFNESFAATNEREGSEIARQIVCALLERRIRVVFVTHLSEFARTLNERRMKNALFLRAEREADGTRSFRVTVGEPLQTSHGEDLYARIFTGAFPGPAPDGSNRPPDHDRAIERDDGLPGIERDRLESSINRS